MTDRRGERFFKSADVLVDLLILVVSVVIGFWAQSGIAERVERGVLLAIGFFLVGLAAHLMFRAITAEDKLTALETCLDDVARNTALALQHFEFLASEQRIRDLRHMLNEKEDLIGGAGLKTVDEYLTAVSASDGMRGIKVKGEQLALDAYRNFWDTLVRHQAQFKENPANSFGSVRITHVNPDKVWDTETGQALISYQRRYVELGGVIVRILLATPPQPGAAVTNIMDRMRKAGIFVYYLENSELRKLTTDFLWVGPYELRWRYTHDLQTLEECEMVQLNASRKEQLRSLWDDLATRVISKEADLPHAEKQVLRDSLLQF